MATYFVDLVIELRIDLVDRLFLCIVKGVVELVDLELFAPFLARGKHQLGLGQVKLASAEEAAVQTRLMSLKPSR